MVRLIEMATSRSDAMSRCMDLGPKFIEHFHKAYTEGKESILFHHHCSEMQGWWDKVKIIRLKPNNKRLSLINYTDWFFTAGSSMDEFGFTEEEEEVYGKFIALLYMESDKKVEDILRDLL